MAKAKAPHAGRRSADHQAAVLARRASGATVWARGVKRQRTRAAAKRAAIRDAS